GKHLITWRIHDQLLHVPKPRLKRLLDRRKPLVTPVLVNLSHANRFPARIGLKLTDMDLHALNVSRALLACDTVKVGLKLRRRPEEFLRIGQGAMSRVFSGGPERSVRHPILALGDPVP